MVLVCTNENMLFASNWSVTTTMPLSTFICGMDVIGQYLFEINC